MTVAELTLAGLTEEDVQHAREKAENLWTETQELQRKLAALRCPPYATRWQRRQYLERKDALNEVLADRTEEYRRLRDGIKNWNIKLANDETREKFMLLRQKSLDAVRHLQRRRQEERGAWLEISDEPLEGALDDLLATLNLCTGQESTDGEWFSPLAGGAR